MRADYHVHTNYSDGSFLEWMVAAAEEAGLEAVGLADHCMLPVDDRARAHRDVAGYNLDLTYERRRRAIEALRDRVDVHILDGVEMDYAPGAEGPIGRFLEEAGFDYAIGSVHTLDGANVHHADAFAGRTSAQRRALVDAYFDDLEGLVRSELFDVAAHVDIVERNPVLRDHATEAHYRQIAAAFVDSATIPELNAGRIDADYGRFHPREAFLEVLEAHDVPLAVGSDAHQPDHLGRRLPQLERAFEARGIEPTDPLGG